MSTVPRSVPEAKATVLTPSAFRLSARVTVWSEGKATLNFLPELSTAKPELPEMVMLTTSLCCAWATRSE